MAWSWQYTDVNTRPVEGPDESFSNQGDAESWLGQNWRELAAKGVAGVSLVVQGADGKPEVEYAMSLLPTTPTSKP